MIFIPGNVPSSKNSRINCARGSFHSKTVRKYLQMVGVKSFSASGVLNYKTRPNLFAEAIIQLPRSDSRPVLLGMHFVRGSKHKFDIVNAQQIILDLLVAHGWIEDDNADCIVPFTIDINDRYYSYDKENPGVYLAVAHLIKKSSII